MAAFMAESWLQANTQHLAKSLAQQLGSSEYSLNEQMNAQKNSTDERANWNRDEQTQYLPTKSTRMSIVYEKTQNRIG